MHEAQSQRTNERDKRAIRRAVYEAEYARNHVVELRVRCVTTVRADLARQWADEQIPHRTLTGIKFHSWRDPVPSFAGECADLVICSGFGDQRVLAELWARLRDDSRVGKWGCWLEMVQ